MRMERLRIAALTAPVVKGVASSPGIGRITHGALSLIGKDRPLAGVAGQRLALRIRVVFAAHFITEGTPPTNRHLSARLPDNPLFVG